VNRDDAGRGAEEVERGRVDSGMVMNFPCQLRKRIPNADKSFSVDAANDQGKLPLSVRITTQTAKNA
jgi:hypothetical protein